MNGNARCRHPCAWQRRYYANKPKTDVRERAKQLNPEANCFRLGDHHLVVRWVQGGGQGGGGGIGRHGRRLAASGWATITWWSGRYRRGECCFWEVRILEASCC